MGSQQVYQAGIACGDKTDEKTPSHKRKRERVSSMTLGSRSSKVQAANEENTPSPVPRQSRTRKSLDLRCLRDGWKERSDAIQEAKDALSCLRSKGDAAKGEEVTDHIVSTGYNSLLLTTQENAEVWASVQQVHVPLLTEREEQAL